MTELSDYKRMIEKPMLERKNGQIRALCSEVDRLRAVLLNIQSEAETGRTVDSAKLATRCRLALTPEQRVGNSEGGNGG